MSGTGLVPEMSVPDFLQYRMPRDAVVHSVFIPYGSGAEIFDTYKTMARHANAHPLVNAGFSFTVNQSTAGDNASTSISAARIVIGGILLGPHLCPKTVAAVRCGNIEPPVIVTMQSSLVAYFRLCCVIVLVRSPPSR